MATVFMKWLERGPEDYDRGIQILTLGRLRRLWAHIAREHVREGARVLDIGCGTGTLAVMMGRAGARVTGADASPEMLDVARQRVDEAGLGERVALERVNALRLDERYAPGSFDLVVASLLLSELDANARRAVLRSAARLLAPGGRLLLADEVVPSGVARVPYYLARWPLALVTWLLTRTGTSPLRDPATLARQAGLAARRDAAWLGGSLALYRLRLLPEAASAEPPATERLRHRVTARTLLLDLWALFLRIIPPYPRQRPGLYRLGQPGPDAPVLVTANFDLTVRRLLGAIDGRVDAWLLIVDTAGINVWCAAGAGYFTAERVIAAVKAARLEERVSHRRLILPQLAATGVDARQVREALGWDARWGPVHAADIPAYLAAGCTKTDAMRRVRFPLLARLEMTTVALGFYGLVILVPLFFLWRGGFLPITASLLGLSYTYAVAQPWLPGRDGLAKSIPLAFLAVAGLLAYAAWVEPLSRQQLFGWGVGVVGLSVLVGGEFQGMSPLMRGEQANWALEALIAVALGLVYWLVPLALGWR